MGKQNNIQKQLRDSKGDLPQEYSWENMQEGIFAKMPKEAAETVVDSPKRRRILPLLLLMGIGLITTGIYTLWHKSSQLSNKTDTQTEQNTELQLKENTTALNRKQIITDQDLNTSNSSIQRSLEDQSQPKSSTIMGNELMSEKAIIALNPSESIPNNTIGNSLDLNYLSQSATTQRNQSTASTVHTENHQSQNTYLSKPNQQNNVYVPSNEPVESLDVIALLQPRYEYTFTLSEESLNAKLITLPNETLKDQKAKNSIKFIANLGSNLYSHNYSGNTLAKARSSNLSPIIGQSASLSIEYTLNPRWSIHAGLAIDRSLTRLDYTGVIDTIISTDVTIHNHNNASGVTSTATSQKEIIGSFVTDVELYNKYLSVGIPVSIKRYIGLGKIDLGIGVGIEYSYRYKSNGRYLVEPTGISPDYQLKSHTADDSFNSHLLNGLLSVNLDYPLNQGVGIGLGLDGTYGITDAVSEGAISSHPIRTRGSLRLFKVF